MLVKNMKSVHHEHAAVRSKQDAGSTFVTVLIVMLVLTIGGLTLSAIALNTVSSVSSAQHRSAAQAEVDGAVAIKTVDLMQGRLKCGAAPGTIRNGSASPNDVSWKLTCVSGDVTGTATLTVETIVDGEKARREAVFGYELLPKSEPLGNAALITKAPLNLAALDIKRVSGGPAADVWIVPDPGINGDFTCNSGGAIAGSVFLAQGQVVGSGGCKVSGDIYSKGDVAIASGTGIGGDLVSLEGSIKVTGGNSIAGSIFAAKDVTGSGLSERFVENIHAGRNLQLAGGSPSARGAITYGENFTRPANPAISAWAVGTVEKRVVAPPAVPVAAKWKGIAKSDLDTLVADGKFERVAWSGACNYSYGHAMVAKIAGLTKPTLIDASACDGTTAAKRAELPQWQDINVKTDIIFMAPSFNLVGPKFKSADGAEHKVWVIAPENPAVNCATLQPINVQGAQMLPAGTSKITGLIFTGCTVHFNNSGEDWQGTVQAGAMTGKPNFWYKPIAFPGQELPGAPESPGDGIDAGRIIPGSFVLNSVRDLPRS